MNEFRHTWLSMRTMFGSGRTIIILALVVVAGVAGFLAIRQFTDPVRGVQLADQLWDRDENVAAVREYKDLLGKRDPLRPEFALVPRADRPRMYRRIITHESIYGSRQEARDWISRCYLEGINFEQADFEHPEVFELWMDVITPLKPDNPPRLRDLADELPLDQGQ